MTLNTNRLRQHSSPETSKAAGAPSSSRVASAVSPSDRLAAECLRLFRSGLDTLSIARRLNITEARASKLLWVARSREKGLPADYLRAGHVARIAP